MLVGANDIVIYEGRSKATLMPMKTPFMHSFSYSNLQTFNDMPISTNNLIYVCLL